MLENWQSWCRLCAKIGENATYQTKSTADHLEIVNNFFRITLLPLERIESTICDECSNFLANLEHFGERCLKTDQMFRELMQTNTISSSNLESIRYKYGVDEEDIKHSLVLSETQDEEEPHQQSRLFDQAGQYSDPLEMEIESSVVVKQEVSDEYVPVAKRPPSDSASDSDLIKRELQNIKNTLKEHGQDLKYLKMQTTKKSYDEHVFKDIKKLLPLSTMKNFKKLNADLHMEKWQEAYASVVAHKRRLREIITDDIACDLSMTGKGPRKPGHTLENFSSSKIYKIWKDTCNDSQFDTKITKELERAKGRVYVKRNAAKKPKGGSRKGGISSTDNGDVSGKTSTTTQDILGTESTEHMDEDNQSSGSCSED